MLNAITFDLEDYYHVTAFEHIIDRHNWENMESRVQQNLEKVLSILDDYKVKATFFTLGWIAERHSILIRTIVNEGHEVASHGYNHKMINYHSKESFKEDITKTKKILEDITGTKVKGYRAPTFSINNSSLWALNTLCEQGHIYDSSIFPIKHDRYGMSHAKRFPHIIEINGYGIKEFPPSTIRVFEWNFPIAGGGYLRLFPIKFIEWGINKLNNAEKQPAIIYIHTWEFDPAQPRIPANWLSRFRHYVNLDSTEKKIRHLIKNFKFTTLNKLCTHLF
jgi:polysaccharide deacetylase family protein (PEP-CTERM system associated)